MSELIEAEKHYWETYSKWLETARGIEQLKGLLRERDRELFEQIDREGLAAPEHIIDQWLRLPKPESVEDLHREPEEEMQQARTRLRRARGQD